MQKVAGTGIVRHTRLTQLKKKFLPKKVLYLPEKTTSFPNEKIHHTLLKKTILCLKKFFLTIPGKIIFLSKKFLILARKSPKKCVLDTTMLFLILAKLGKVFNKLIRVIGCAKSYIKNLY